jgi:acetylornithine deacetylase/succinyl-diaminopimelate desuccinylase-like protein
MSKATALLDERSIVETLAALVRINSITNHEQAISDWMAERLAEIGLRDVTRLPVPESGDTVLGWIDGPADGPTFCLNFHLDTFGVFNGWETDPFTPVIRDGRMYGLGVHDMKAGGACILAAAEALVKSKAPLRGRVLLACTTDEENWSRGAHALIASGALRGCIGAMVPEPTPYGSLRIGARGRHVIVIHLKGQSAHVAFDAPTAINSAHDAARIINVLADTGNLGLRRDPRFGLRSGLGVTGVHSGGEMILVPEEARIIVDRHLLPGETLEEALAHLRGLIARAGISGTYSLTWDKRPTPAPGAFVVPPEGDFVRTVQRIQQAELGRPVALTIARSVADVNHIAVHGGVPTITCGPWGGNTCEANEWVDLAALLPVARIHVETVLAMLRA